VRAAIALSALFVFAAPAAWSQGTDDPPTLFERWQARKEKSPALEQKLLTAIDVMKKVAWMEGRWDVNEKVYKTGTTPELVAKGTRESRVDLDGRCLVSRQTVGNLKTIDALIYDAYQGYWFRQIMTNGGRGAIQPLVATSSWDNGGLTFSGSLWAFGEKADVRVRIQKESDDAYYEIFEERLAGAIRPILEYRYTRVPATQPAPKK
jgi:hypothetical protein